MITHTAQATNAIKWIDSLKGGKKGFKKGTGSLGQYDVHSDSKDKIPDTYCCLGVGCRVLDVSVAHWWEIFSKEFSDKVGLNDEEGTFLDPKTRLVMNIGGRGIVDINDECYSMDTDFKRMRIFILKHLDNMFIPGVAGKLKQHYGK
jgi:hypothetical protein